MLHGCKQNAEEFAACTRMDAFADLHDFLVAWPSQSVRRNRGKCWNWFEPAHQSRGRGEPGLLAEIVEQVIDKYPVDPARIFVAGFSAGGAMALLLGQTYPDLFSGVASHSGVPVAAALGPASALKAMKEGTKHPGAWSVRRPVPVRTIIFQGAADRLVAPQNSQLIADDAVHAFRRHSSTLVREREPVTRPGKRPCLLTRHRDATGKVMVEQWVIEGGRHAWSGGAPRTCLSDPLGPDASAELVRFLMEQTSSQAPAALNDTGAQ